MLEVMRDELDVELTVEGLCIGPRLVVGVKGLEDVHR